MSSQFHQHVTSSFCTNILAPKSYKAKLSLQKSFKRHFHIYKVESKMLVKLTPGVNFTNILLSAFMCADPKCAKKTVNSLVSFALLRPTCIKGRCKMLIKLTPVVNLIKDLQAAFAPVDPKRVKRY